MALPANEWMDKARSLTRSGKLAEATAAIQRALGRIGVPAAGPAAGPSNASNAPRMSREAATVAKTATGSTVDRDAEVPDRGHLRRADAGRTAGFVTGKHDACGLQRAYKVFVPTRLEPGPALVVMLHGCTQSPDDFAIGTRMNAWAERQGFVVLYPAQSRTANPSGCWNWYQTSDQQRDGGEVGLLASLTRKIVDDYGIDPSRVYVAGLSAGGAMAANLGAAWPDLYAAIGVHSGLAAGAANNVVDALGAMRDGARTARLDASRHRRVRAVPTIVFHGDRDTTVHPDNGSQVVAAALGDAMTGGSHDTEERVASSGAATTRHRYRDVDGVVQVEHWVLRGGGHAWAGGDARGTHTDPKGVDASAELLRFFASHRLAHTTVD